MIEIVNKEDCCGCSACEQVCPKGCIELRADAEGFLYPVVEVAKCVDCSMCDRVCPVINQGDAQRPLKVYAAKNRDEQIRYESSSGGLFTALAESVLGEGGVVFGVEFDSDWSAKHSYVESADELHRFRGSKYLQSRMESSYSDVKRFLKEGRKVLFSGTSCQTAGLRRFLGRDYENLLSVDLICHGVPSPMLWQDYLNTLENRGDIKSIKFRDKRVSWNNFEFKVDYKSQPSFSVDFRKDLYFMGFLKNLYLRPSCYACPAKGGRCASDITIADYWGVQRVLPKFHDDKGVGLALTWSDKGQMLYESCGFDSAPTSLGDAVKGNICYHSSVKRSCFVDMFWDSYCQEGFVHAVSLALQAVASQPAKKKSLLSRLWKSLKNKLKGEK